MSDQHERKLEELLRSRRVEPPKADLAERIILEARAIEQRSGFARRPLLSRLLGELPLPNPALLLACTLLLGILLGFGLPYDATDSDSIYLQDFLYVEGDIYEQ
jgi:hypothetical protein